MLLPLICDAVLIVAATGAAAAIHISRAHHSHLTAVVSVECHPDDDEDARWQEIVMIARACCVFALAELERYEFIEIQLNFVN